MRIVLILKVFLFFLFTLPNQSKSSSCINFAFLKYLCQEFSFRLQTYNFNKPAFIGLFQKISTPLPWWVFLVLSLLPLSYPPGNLRVVQYSDTNLCMAL